MAKGGELTGLYFYLKRLYMNHYALVVNPFFFPLEPPQRLMGIFL